MIYTKAQKCVGFLAQLCKSIIPRKPSFDVVVKYDEQIVCLIQDCDSVDGAIDEFIYECACRTYGNHRELLTKAEYYLVKNQKDVVGMMIWATRNDEDGELILVVQSDDRNITRMFYINGELVPRSSFN